MDFVITTVLIIDNYSKLTFVYKIIVSFVLLEIKTTCIFILRIGYENGAISYNPRMVCIFVNYLDLETQIWLF